MYLRPIDIPRSYTFQTMGVLFSLCKLGVEITRSEFKMQEMAEMLIRSRPRGSGFRGLVVLTKAHPCCERGFTTAAFHFQTQLIE